MHAVRLLIALALVGSSAGRTHAADALPAASSIKGVPFIQQMTNYCGPASLASIFAYWKVKVSQKEIGACTYDPKTKGTNAGDLLMFCRDRGLSAYSLNGTLFDLKWFISEGYPVLVLQNVSRTDITGHFRVAMGYDDKAGVIILRDSMDSNLVRMKYGDFQYLWEKRGYWAMLVMPHEKDIFQQILGEWNPVVHMDLAQAYLHKGSYDEAEVEAQKALNVEPDNPYAKDFLRQAQEHSPVQL